jgi:hypothetical protein
VNSVHVVTAGQQEHPGEQQVDADQQAVWSAIPVAILATPTAKNHIDSTTVSVNAR